MSNNCKLLKIEHVLFLYLTKRLFISKPSYLPYLKNERKSTPNHKLIPNNKCSDVYGHQTPNKERPMTPYPRLEKTNVRPTTTVY